MSEPILHITQRTAWEQALKSGKYTADSLAEQGFIHCSKAEQVLRVANDFYKGQHGLVLLKIDLERLTARLRWEPGTDLATELFPHIYGPIDLGAVMEVLDFDPEPDGTFLLPDSLHPVNKGKH